MKNRHETGDGDGDGGDGDGGDGDADEARMMMKMMNHIAYFYRELLTLERQHFVNVMIPFRQT